MTGVVFNHMTGMGQEKKSTEVDRMGITMGFLLSLILIKVCSCCLRGFFFFFSRIKSKPYLLSTRKWAKLDRETAHQSHVQILLSLLSMGPRLQTL